VRQTRRDVDIQSDGRTVWVHASDGACIGRFGWMGVDIHRAIDDQSMMGECLCCTHGRTGAVEWRLFVDGMLEHHGVTVDERYRPTGLD
jgi:hypothetical protein